MPNNILITPGSASIQFSGSVANTIRLQVEPSGSVAFYGNNGSLFGITDTLSGSLMSVNDISGLPILEVFSDDRVVMGTYNRNTLVVTGSRVGIDKAVPQADLDVSGSVFVTGSLGVTNGITGSLSYTNLVNVPVGIVSGALQVVPLLPAGIVSSSTQISYTGITNIPSGIVSSSTQASTWTVASASVATSSSYAVTASYALASAGGGGGGGTKTLAVFTPLDNNPPATAFATLDTRNSIAILDFDAATAESAVFVGIIPEGAVLTSGLTVTIDWTAASATSGVCVWGVQFEKTSGGLDIDSDSFDTAVTGSTTTSGTSGVVNSTTITTTNIDSLVAGDLFRLKAYRDATAGADTMTGDAELIAVELRAV
jgi:hypothetical protein